MLKKRIIPIQLLINNRLVKTIGFGKYRDVGNPVSSSKIYNDSDADELIFLNIDREERSIGPLLSLIKKVSEACFMPLSLGGGVKTIDDASRLIQNGADKIVLNSAIYDDLNLIEKIAYKYGNQAVVASVDVRKNKSKDKYNLYSNCGRDSESVDLVDHLTLIENQGAGEIIITSIDQDGTMKGYDKDLIKTAVENTSIPIIGAGGAGTFDHLKEAFLETDVSALACGSLFNFGDNNPIRAKAFLTNYSIPFKII
tara:strand:- start:2197 stop:2961 length:765 start_codon:yes stop_codon:yes gene_type:complete